jgi:hypothetical protein
MTIRNLEVRLTRLEDNILGRFGYREYVVEVGNTALDPVPEVVQKSLSAYSETKLSGFINALGGQGNPISFYELAVSRLIAESTIRQFSYWKLTRDGIVSECLPVSITVEDARYKVILATIKQTVVSP